MVLKVCSILLLPPLGSSPFSVPPILVEQHHTDLESVTIYDPTSGVHIVPLSHLLAYQVHAVCFKRGSRTPLICPKLVQRFAALPLPRAIHPKASKFSIISLFDGSGSFTDVIAKALDQWPHAILAAENDPGTRSVVAKVKGWPLDGTLWSFDKNGAHSFYAKDVWLLIQDNCLLLRQFLSLLPEDSIIFVAAGFPCPDLTIIGRGKGALGVVGDRSVLLHSGWAVLYFLSLTPFWRRVVVLFENAGSMQDHMKAYIHALLGIPAPCAHYLNCAKWGSVSRARYFFSSSSIAVLPTSSPSPFDENWSPTLLPSTLEPKPLPPWLRPRRTTDKGSVVQTPLAYHPRNLLYDTTYFGGPSGFRKACVANHPTAYPELPFKEFLPEFLWDDWDSLVAWEADYNAEMTKEILDIVSRLQDFYSNPFIYLPFRLPSLQEKARDSELSDLIHQTIQDASPPLRTLHNIIGNFFKPSAVLAALGGTVHIQNLVAGTATPHLWSPASPQRVDANFIEIRTRVLNETSGQPRLQQHVAQRWFPKHVPRVDLDDFWSTSKFLPAPAVVTTPVTTFTPPLLQAPATPISPISPAASALLTQDDVIAELLQSCIFHSYPLDVLLGKHIPPFDNITLPILLTPPMLYMQCFIHAYFLGWELYQKNDAVIVLHEAANGNSLAAYGNFDSPIRIYLFIFTAASPLFLYAILLQHVSPPTALPRTLSLLHSSWTFPLHLQFFQPLLSRFPTISLFNSLSSASLDQPSIYQPWGQSFTPLKLGSSSFFCWVAALFESHSNALDSPMWSLRSPPPFSGSFPFMVHVQFWLFVHDCHQASFHLPISPFVFVHWLRPDIPPSPTSIDASFYFCIDSARPDPETLQRSLCPHLFVCYSRDDLHYDYYGVVIDRPLHILADSNVAAIQAKFIQYP